MEIGDNLVCVCVVDGKAGARRASGRAVTDSELIQDEVDTQMSFCQCRHQFPATRLAEGKYKVCLCLDQGRF